MLAAPMKILSLLLLLALLAGCASGPPKRLEAPQLRLQELEDLGDTWRLRIAVRNLGNFTVEFDAIELRFELDGHDPGPLRRALDFDVPGFASELLEIELTPSAAQRAALARLGGDAGTLPYRLHGEIRLGEPRRSFAFDTTAFLSPTPGRPGSFR